MHFEVVDRASVVSLSRSHSGRSWLLPSLAISTVFSIIWASNYSSLHVVLRFHLFRYAINSLLQLVPDRPNLFSSSFITVRSFAYLALILAASKLNTFTFELLLLSVLGRQLSAFSFSVPSCSSQLVTRNPQTVLSILTSNSQLSVLSCSSQLVARNSQSLVRSSQPATRNS